MSQPEELRWEEIKVWSAGWWLHEELESDRPGFKFPVNRASHFTSLSLSFLINSKDHCKDSVTCL